MENPGWQLGPLPYRLLPLRRLNPRATGFFMHIAMCAVMHAVKCASRRAARDRDRDVLISRGDMGA